ncbi:uncharacterized protein HMPREF1541_10152 [Cyphellophora europaea CBS 101466]|uniref:Uncharacterized protein n=1 Tax=Cyphellophora europaea (strain CBS 101466) TaxID=1220924 RepID=W2S729_CYPE1|nr:uncharacterized protein HMPREF1541_10152 [Cyphellophora europaea CBS 101466]ETN44482.1 hypothetical protein HMPREF1541_10152 [Cyphellophora europaea CBS 101466]
MLPTAAFSRRLTRAGALVFACFAFAFLTLHLYSPISYKLYHDPKRLHVAVFATSGNYFLCQLHLSAALLGFPAPVFINWNDEEDKDEMKQHLAKIEGALSYLESIPSHQQDDLVLMMDGFDIWFQLPHDYILQRYHQVVARAHERHVQAFGEELVAKHNIRNTVIFGPDKSCAPAGQDHVSCWAIPESWLPPMSFGPDTDHGRAMHNRPRWLNSGTVIGPARELKDVFERALQQNRDNHVTDSDQFYFSHVFGVQSYARRLLKLEYDAARGCDVAGDQEFLHPQHVDPKKKSIPNTDGRTEYYIGLDWSSDMFQTAGFYADYLTWIRHNQTSQYIQQQSETGNYHHHFTLPEDLLGRGPSEDKDLSSIDPALASWQSLPLATNTASKTVPTVMHINGKKGYRHLWWPRNWFFPYIEPMLKALRRQGIKNIGGDREALAGAWTFLKGEYGWEEWNTVCGRYEDRLMGKTKEPD